LVGLLGALVATNQPAALSNLVLKTTGAAISVPDPNDKAEQELAKIMADDNAAQADADRWIEENQKFAANGGGMSEAELSQKIRQRFEAVQKAYQDFIAAHPSNVRARIAYASFLGDTGGEQAAREQLEKALALDTNNPAIYNNLANIEGHTGDPKKAFEYYAKAIQLNPREPVYFHNFGTTVYLFRKDAREYYNITEYEVFNKALFLYSNALHLDPNNFPLATDIAQGFYAIKPFRLEAALQAWTNALNIARDEVEREGTYLHFARTYIIAGNFPEARNQLHAVTNSMYDDLKRRLQRTLEEKEREGKGASPADATNTAASK
jgi:tetratricopeptide (TPR) repeat protein